MRIVGVKLQTAFRASNRLSYLMAAKVHFTERIQERSLGWIQF
jgi:hypothetical protein